MSTCLSILSRRLPFNRQTSLVRAACSLSVLAVSGALPFSFPTAAHAQAAGAAIAPNTLPVLRSVVSGRAVVNAPVAGAGRSLMTIDQSSQRAIIDWRSFNIGSASEVQFRQPNSTAPTLNRIYDANPSVIRGKLTANGQVLLINQNGILFDRGTQVNVQSLVASTLNLTNERFLSGVLTAGGLTTPAFACGYDERGNTLAARPDGTRPAPLSLGAFGDASSAAPALQAGADPAATCRIARSRRVGSARLDLQGTRQAGSRCFELAQVALQHAQRSPCVSGQDAARCSSGKPSARLRIDPARRAHRRVATAP